MFKRFTESYRNRDVLKHLRFVLKVFAFNEDLDIIPSFLLTDQTLNSPFDLCE